MRLEGFVNGSYETQSRILAGERCMNLFPETVPQGNKSRGALFSAPGLPTFAEMPSAPGRGIFAHKGRLFSVFGTTLYEVASNGTATGLGTVAADDNPATFDTNGDGGNELIVSSGDRAYVFDLGSSAFTNPLASGSTQIGQLDGFFVSLNAATSTFRLSDALDGNTWSGIQVAQRTSASDPWVSMIVARGEIYLFGDKTGEVWYNAGLPVFPFAQRPEGFFETGIASSFSISKFAGTIAWLGRTDRGKPAVYIMDGYTPTPISTPAVEWAIQQYQDAVGVDDAVGWSYDREGHEFYVLTFPSSNATWVYDFTTQKWHERGFWSKDAGDYLEYRPIFHASCFGKNLVCDSSGNKIYSMSSTTYTDVGGSELRRMRRMPHTSNENKRIYFPWAELECDRGVGNSNDPGANPLVALRYSNNGGNTWGASRTRALGAMGKVDTRVRWECCGAGRDRVWELWQSDPNPSRWFDFYFDAAPGVH